MLHFAPTHLSRLCVFVLGSRKERLCNGCMTERQRDTTSECEDTDTDGEADSSVPCDSLLTLGLTHSDSSPTLDEHESTICADDSLLSSCDVADTAALDQTTSQSAAENSDVVGAWSVRGSAYSALTWVSGVMSRSFVRRSSEPMTDSQSADPIDAAAENDTQTEDISSSDVAASAGLTDDQCPVIASDDLAVSSLPCNDATTDHDLSHDLTTSDTCQNHADHRYCVLYSSELFLIILEI